MKTLLKKYGLIGGTAVACIACCAAPSLMVPVLAWLGVAGAGFIYSPWLLALSAVPALMLLAQFRNRKSSAPRGALPAARGCAAPCVSNQRNKHECQ